MRSSNQTCMTLASILMFNNVSFVRGPHSLAFLMFFSSVPGLSLDLDLKKIGVETQKKTKMVSRSSQKCHQKNIKTVKLTVRTCHRLPTIHFQVRLLLVSGRISKKKGMSQQIKDQCLSILWGVSRERF